MDDDAVTGATDDDDDDDDDDDGCAMSRRAVVSRNAGLLRELVVRSATEVSSSTSSSSSSAGVSMASCGGQRTTYATATKKKPTTAVKKKKPATATATATATKKRATKKASAGSAATPKISRRAKPPNGRTRALPHVAAMKTPLHESVLNDVAYKAVGPATWKRVGVEVPRRYPPPPKTNGAAPRGLPHASAAKFPLHESVLAEQRAGAQARMDAVKTQAGAKPAVPPPAAAVEMEAKTLLEPLSKPKSGSSSAVPATGAASSSSSSSSNAGGGHEEQQAASRTPFLAAAGAVLVAYLAYAVGADDPEDLPPPPRRSKPKSKAPAARRDVEVEVQIVKQPEEKELDSASKGTRAADAASTSPAAEKEKENEKEEAKKELNDAFSAAADFLANAEVGVVSQFDYFPRFYSLNNLSGPITHLLRLFHAAPDLSRAKINVCPARTHANRASDAAGVLRVVASPRLVPVSQPTFLSSSRIASRACQSMRRFI